MSNLPTTSQPAAAHLNAAAQLFTPDTSPYATLSTLNFPSALSSPFLIDTAFILILQTAYFLLSRRFLTSAIPTLKQMSEAEPDSLGAGDGATGGRTGGGARTGEGDGGNYTQTIDSPTSRPGLNSSRSSFDGSSSNLGPLLNASGGMSDRESNAGANSSGRRDPGRVSRVRAEDEDDSDDSSVMGGGTFGEQLVGGVFGTGTGGGGSSEHGGGISTAPVSDDESVYEGRNGGNDVPLLPLHSTDGSGILNAPPRRSSRAGFLRRDTDPHKSGPDPRTPSNSQTQSQSRSTRPEPSIRAPTASPTLPLPSKKRKVLRLFHGRSPSASPRSGKNGNSTLTGLDAVKKIRATRGLGWLARNLFSLCFSESLSLLTLVMFHSLGVLHSKSRHFHFSFSLRVLLLLILFVIPLVQCLQLTYRSRDHGHHTTASSSPSASTSSRRRLSISKRLLISLVPFSLYIFLFTRIPPYVTTLPNLPVAPLSAAGLNRTITIGSPLTKVKTRPPSFKHLAGSIHLGDLADLDPAEQEEEEFVTMAGDAGDEYAQEVWQKGGWLEPSLGRVVVCGVVVLGGLSGLGAVRTSWMFFENGAGRNGQTISREDLITAERSLFRVRHDIHSKRLDLASRSNDLAPTTPGHRTRGGSALSGNYNPTWVGRVFGNSFGGNAETNSLRRELAGLEAMEINVKRGLDAMRVRRQRQKFARTLRGKVFLLVGYIFAAYCIARVLMCLTSVFFPPLSTSHVPEAVETPVFDSNGKSKAKGNTNGDWISFLLALGVSHLPEGVVGDVDVALWSRAISLLLTGLLILSSLVSVLRSVSRILRLTSKTIGAGFLLLGLGQLMSTYTISLLIQLRSTIPPALPELDIDQYGYSTNSSAIGAGIALPYGQGATILAEDPSLLSSLPDFRVFGRLFDVMFLIAATVTLVFKYGGHKINGADGYGDVYR